MLFQVNSVTSASKQGLISPRQLFKDCPSEDTNVVKDSLQVNLKDYNYQSPLDMQISEAEEASSKKQAELSEAAARFEDYQMNMNFNANEVTTKPLGGKCHTRGH